MTSQQQPPRGGPAPQQSQALAIAEPVEATNQAMALVPSSLDGAYQLAAWLSNAQLLPPALRGKQADLFTMILAGMELGLPPMAALRGMYIVNGKPALEAKTKAAICLQRGAALYFKRTEYTPEATTWETFRRGQTEPVPMRFTRKEAEAAGLTRKDGPWQQYPQRMISWRALGWLCDDVYPDIVLGVATAEDFDAEPELAFRPISAGGTPVEIAAAPAAPKLPAPPPAAPATAKPAGPPPGVPHAPAQLPPLTEDDVIDAIERMTKAGTEPELRKIAAELGNRFKTDTQRDRLLAAHKAQLAEIRAAQANEAAAEAPAKDGPP